LQGIGELTPTCSMEAHMLAFIKSTGWILAADFLGFALLASLLIGGKQSATFAVLFMAAPLVMLATMLWGPRT
jgi:hypothetical protein